MTAGTTERVMAESVGEMCRSMPAEPVAMMALKRNLLRFCYYVCMGEGFSKKTKRKGL